MFYDDVVSMQCLFILQWWIVLFKKKKPQTTVLKSFSMSKTCFSLLHDKVSYLFDNSESKALALGNGVINSISIAELVVVKLDQHR